MQNVPTSCIVFPMSVYHILRELDTHLTLDVHSFTIHSWTGSGFGKDRCKEEILFVPPSGTVSIRMPSGG
jgi:hypothetical protein